jgi:hypothetical protein
MVGPAALQNPDPTRVHLFIEPLPVVADLPASSHFVEA